MPFLRCSQPRRRAMTDRPMFRQFRVSVGVSLLFTLILAVPWATVLAHPGSGIVVDHSGRMYVADPERDRVWVLPVVNGKSQETPVVALTAHVHALGLAPEGVILAEAQEYDPRTNQWRSRLWELRHPAQPKPRVTRLASGFVTATSTRRDSAGRGYAWDADMVNRSYSRLLLDDQGRKHTLAGGAWRREDQHESQLLGNVGDFLVTPEGVVWFTDFSCVRKLERGVIISLSCDGALRRPLLSLTLGEHNHLRGLARSHQDVTWVANYASRSVVRVAADGKQSIALRSGQGFKPVGLFHQDQRLYVLEHGRTALRVRVKDLSTGQVNDVARFSQ